MQMQSLSDILFQIDNGTWTLPKFQRGYVWKRPDVSDLMRSLYKGYPIGNLLVWQSQASSEVVRGNSLTMGQMQNLLLDGQQRVTSLYGIIKDKVPAFSDGNPHAFRDLYFNVETEEFEFYGHTKMKNNWRWVSVTELMQKDEYKFEHRFKDISPEDKSTYMRRLGRVCKIKERRFYVESVTSEDKTMDDVVDIFNKVNSGGTKLSKGDLALAKISAKWPQAREEMLLRLQKWESQGYRFSLDWLLRCINAIVTGQSQFEFIAEVSAEEFQDGLKRAEKHIDNALTLLRSHLGLMDSSVLRSPNSLPAIVSYFDKIKGIPGFHQQCRLMYWYVYSALRGRYSSASETAIRQDLVAIAENDDPITALIHALEEYFGDLKLWTSNFDASTSNSRFFPMLYMMTCVYGARDLCSGLKLGKWAVGAMSYLERHHLFPKSQLKKHGITKVSEINALANFTFLTAPCNGEISNCLPRDYFPHYEAKFPGVLASHWIPNNPELWKIENYHEFLAERRKLLANSANDFLNHLLNGSMPEAEAGMQLNDQLGHQRPIHIGSAEEEASLNNAMAWMELHDLPRGEFGFELVDENNEPLATIDLAWPRGIQTGRGRPVALLIDEDDETQRIVNSNGYTCFYSVPELKEYIQRNILREPQPA